MTIVYIIKHDLTGRLYIGITDNLNQRIKSHNEGRNKSTKRLSGEWVLIYAEAYRSKQDALERERKLKHFGNSKQRLMKRISKSLIVEKRAD